MELKKQIRAIDLALLAGQKRLSPRTGFIHFYPEEDFTDTIPLYENFCYAFALMRQKTTEGVENAKELLFRLLAFQARDGNFPVYLHEFPKCVNCYQGLKIGAILAYVLRHFSRILGDLNSVIEKSLEMILIKSPEHPFWQNRYKALLGLHIDEIVPATPSNWTEWVITCQLANQTEFQIPYDPDLQLFKGSHVQEKGEPRPHPIEWLLAEGNYSPRLLKDHPLQLYAALLFPLNYIPIEQDDPSYRFFWKGTSALHSLEGAGLVFDLQQPKIGREDLFEAALYCNRSPETKISVNGKKATTFYLNDKIEIQTMSRKIVLTFHLREGEGDFCGHIFPANRPSQQAKGYEAYDWHIGLRTLRRSEKARIEIEVSTET